LESDRGAATVVSEEIGNRQTANAPEGPDDYAPKSIKRKLFLLELDDVR